MQFRNKFRVVTAAALIATMGLVGCGKAPLGLPAGVMEAEDFDALSKPVNQEAIALAKRWQPDATQMSTAVSNSGRGVQDDAIFAFTSARDRDHILLVKASNGRVESYMTNMSDRAASAIKDLLPMNNQASKLLNSKKIFKAAESLGLKNAETAVVTSVRTERGVEPMAVVTDESGKKYMVLNAVTGEPLTAVQSTGMRKVQFHVIIIAAVVVVGAAVAWGVYQWKKRKNPTPKPTTGPTAQPTLPPTPSPAPTTVPTSHPATDVSRILAGPFGDMFDRLDGDKDGALTLAEYLRPAPDGTTIKVKTDEYQAFIDPRNSGKVSRANFLKGIEGSIMNKCSMSFSMLDANQDSGLDGQELNGELQPHVIKEADTNGDGKLSQAEYSVPFAKNEAIFAAYYK